MFAFVIPGDWSLDALTFLMNGISLIIFEIGDYGYHSRSTYTFLMDGLVIKKLLLLAVFKLNVNIFMNYCFFFFPFFYGDGGHAGSVQV